MCVWVSVICCRFCWLLFLKPGMFLHLALCPSAFKHLMIHCNTLPGVENKRARKYRSGQLQLLPGGCKTICKSQNKSLKLKTFWSALFKQITRWRYFYFWKVVWQFKFSSNECQCLKNYVNLFETFGYQEICVPSYLALVFSNLVPQQDVTFI